MSKRSVALDAVLALADEHGRIVTRRQALQCGMSAKAIECQLARGEWQHVYPPASRGKRPGVYATFSGSLGWFAHLCAAVFVCGRGAILSHNTAAEVHGLFDRSEPPAPIHVTVPSGRTVRPPAGIVLHYSSRLTDSRHPAKSPPSTRVEHTVVDLTQHARGLDAACAIVAQAVQKRLTTHDRIADLYWHVPQAALAARTAGDVRSGRRRGPFAPGDAIRAADRQVRRKADGHGYVVDNRYRRHKLRVELDGQRGHTGDGVFRDMWRDNAAVLDGDQQLRFGWDDVDGRSCDTAAVVAALLDVPPSGCSSSCPAPTRFDQLRRRRIA